MCNGRKWVQRNQDIGKILRTVGKISVWEGITCNEWSMWKGGNLDLFSILGALAGSRKNRLGKCSRDAQETFVCLETQDWLISSKYWNRDIVLKENEKGKNEVPVRKSL